MKLKKIVSCLSAVIITLSLFIIPVSAESDWSDYGTDAAETTAAEAESNGDDLQAILSPTDATSSSDYHVQGKDTLINSTQASADIYAGYIDIIPKVTTDDLLQWATTKGNEIIYLLQIVCQPVAIICFIVSAFIMMFGSISKGGKASAGVWGMVCSILVYAGVLYAPVILQTFVGWVAS